MNKQSSSKTQAGYKQAKTSIKKATIAMRKARKGGKRAQWEYMA